MGFLCPLLPDISGFAVPADVRRSMQAGIVGEIVLVVFRQLQQVDDPLGGFAHTGKAFRAVRVRAEEEAAGEISENVEEEAVAEISRFLRD